MKKILLLLTILSSLNITLASDVSVGEQSGADSCTNISGCKDGTCKSTTATDTTTESAGTSTSTKK